MHVRELSHKLKVSADLKVSLMSKYTKVTEASEALVSTMAYHITHKQYDQDTDLSTGTITTKQVNPVYVHQDTSRKALLGHCAHVHKSTVQVCKPGESLALRKVKHPHNGKTSVNRLPLTKQDILSQYSGSFEGIGCFPGDPYKFHLKPEHKPA